MSTLLCWERNGTKESDQHRSERLPGTACQTVFNTLTNEFFQTEQRSETNSSKRNHHPTSHAALIRYKPRGEVHDGPRITSVPAQNPVGTPYPGCVPTDHAPPKRMVDNAPVVHDSWGTLVPKNHEWDAGSQRFGVPFFNYGRLLS